MSTCSLGLVQKTTCIITNLFKYLYRGEIAQLPYCRKPLQDAG